MARGGGLRSMLVVARAAPLPPPGQPDPRRIRAPEEEQGSHLLEPAAKEGAFIDAAIGGRVEAAIDLVVTGGGAAFAVGDKVPQDRLD